MGRKLWWYCSCIFIAALLIVLSEESAHAFTSSKININNAYSPDELHEKIASRHPLLADQISQPTSFVRSVEDWFIHYLNLSSSDQKKINTRWPNCTKSIQRLGRQRLHKWLSFFLSNEVGMDHDQLRKMIISRPQLLSYKLSNIQSTTIYFREELGLQQNEYTTLLMKYPSVLMYSVDKRLRPIVDFLQNECGGGKENWVSWRKIIHTYPHVFSHSLEKRLLPKVNFLCNGNLGLRRDELSQVVAKFPPTLWLSEENLQSKLDFLSESMDLNGAELRTIIVSYPQILGLSLDNNLKVKVMFFLGPTEHHEEGSTTADHSINSWLNKSQLKDYVLYQPALLAYSLENRIKPRIARMLEKNIFL